MPFLAATVALTLTQSLSGRLAPAEAASLIAETLGPNRKREWKPSARERRRAGEIADRIDWPDLERERPRFRSSISLARASALKSGLNRQFDVALALVLAAWDLRLGRGQYINLWAGLDSADPRAIRITSAASPPSSFVSPEWPWRLESGRPVLGEFSYVGHISRLGTVEDYANLWYHRNGATPQTRLR